MNKLDNWIDNRLIRNIAVWLLLYALFLLIIQSDHVFRDALFIILFIMPSVYINNLIIVPIYYQNKKVLSAFLWCFNLLAFSAIVVFALTLNISEFEWRMAYNSLGVCILILSFSTALKIALDSSERRQEAKDAELKLLKAQLNPHFLFNTFNNLYGLSVVKSDKLPGLMLKLSDLLRYSLYETKSTFVSLEKEVQYLESYISLERIRIEDKAKINFRTDIDPETNIPPMLLIVFVENAFKHLNNSDNANQIVDIEIESKAKRLYFRCKNSIGKNRTVELNNNSGIGLNNVKKRLNLLYPNNHELSISKDEFNFNIDLKLNP